MRLRLAVLAGLLLLAIAPGAAYAARGLTVGFNGAPQLTSSDPATSNLWDGRAVNEGGSIVRLNVFWSQVAPATPPAGFNAADPSSPGYNWTAVDAAVRVLSGHGLKVMLTILSAPKWAEGAGRPSSAPAGTWRPDPGQYAAFATAAATRYDGSFPDPAAPGLTLPRVAYWQPWNEPNLFVYINPQWVPASGGGFTDEAAIIYRGLLNAFYGAVKHVASSNFVVTAGTAPFGDPPGGQRVPPVQFDRDLFCIQNGPELSALPCPDPPHLDALSHHPYGVGGPLWHAANPDDASVPDLYKIANVLHFAESVGHVQPAGPKQLWDTEVSWDSSPPDPHGIPINRQARWVEQTMYVLWQQGVSTVLWLQIVDAPPIPSYAASNQGGMYYITGAAKPAALALRFPFVTQRRSKSSITAWGRAPLGGKLRIQAKHGRRWKTLRTVRVRKGHVFDVRVKLRGRAVLRGKLHGLASLTWTQGR